MSEDSIHEAIVFVVTKVTHASVYQKEPIITVVLDPVSAPKTLSPHSPVTLVFGLGGADFEDGTEYEVGQKYHLELVKE